MIVINMFAGPGAGKSTGATYVFSKLKMAGVNAEYVPEYAKDLAWENTLRVYYNQFHIGVEQYRRIHRLEKDCDVVVTDSPLLQQYVYDKDPLFKDLMVGLFERYNNYNFFIKRTKTFNPKGRKHNLDQAIEIDKQIQEMLEKGGYGILTIQGSNFLIHRFMYELYIGKIPEGLTIDHLCRNKKCCNPLHLEAVTYTENNMRSNCKSSINAKKKCCKNGHILQGKNLYIKPKSGERNCRICRSNYAKNRRKNKNAK